MPNTRLSMRHIKEILRLKLEAKLSHRQIARSLGIGVGTVSVYAKRALALELCWPLPAEMSNNELEQLLFPSPNLSARHGRVMPDCAAMHQELKRKGVTKQLLWEEYKQAHGDAGYQYSQYCGYYREWRAQQKRSMRQLHLAGEKLFVDYSGATVPIVNPDTGEVRCAEIFVATLGASNYTFATASWTQRKADWIDAHIQAFEFFGGVPEIIVPDQLRSAVSKPCRYEPTINTSYQHMASHYKTVVIPARPLKPKDKAKAENAVLIVQRWILAKLRHHTFFTLAELNLTIKSLLEDLNQRPFKKLPGSRLSQFHALDQPALKPLPATRYEYLEFKLARVILIITLSSISTITRYRIIWLKRKLKYKPAAKESLFSSKVSRSHVTHALNAREGSPPARRTCRKPTNTSSNGHPRDCYRGQKPLAPQRTPWWILFYSEKKSPSKPTALA